MQITIYSTSTCGTCHILTEWLDKKGIIYSKKVTDEDQSAMEEFMAVNDGIVGVPFTVITDDSGHQTKLTGYDPRALQGALRIS